MSRKEFVQIFKRFFIAFLCCIPVFVVIGIFLTDIIGSAWTIVIYVVIGAGAFLLAELIHSKRKIKLEEKREKSRLKRKYKNIVFEDENVGVKENKKKKINKAKDVDDTKSN